MMNAFDAQQFNDACTRFDAGDFTQALDELLDLAARIKDPWDKAELLYNEAMFLLEMGRVAEARQRVEDLNKSLASLVRTPSDGDEYDVSVSLPVMARHADLKVAIKEGRREEALQLIEDLIIRYPKQLSLHQFRTMFEEVTTLRGIVLAGLGRWEEAKPLLESATPPKVWRNYHSYYLGQCYYKLRDFQRARQWLSEAITLGLISSWMAPAHFLLGSAEYELSDMEAARRQFELCVKSPDHTYVDMAEVWRGLEETSRALGFGTEAENYRRLRTGLPPEFKVN